jgi:hypothetical protein
MSGSILHREIHLRIRLLRNRLAFAISALLLIAGCDPTSYPDTAPPPTFTSLQTNILSVTCNGGGCHSGTQPAALLDLSSGNAYTSLLTHRIENDTGRKYFPARVVPGAPNTSFLMAKLDGHLTPDEGDQMPQRLHPLPQDQIDSVRKWIQGGAQNN